MIILSNETFTQDYQKVTDQICNQPNGKGVKCIGDKGNGYLIVTTDEEITPNTWITHKSQLKEIIESYE